MVGKVTIWRLSVLLAVVLVFMVAGTLALVFTLVFVHSGRNDRNMSMRRYQMLEIDPSNGDVKFCEQDCSMNLRRNDFVFDVKDSGKATLISNIGSQQYICTGSCSCEDIDFRRNARVMNGVGYLLVAATSLVAYSLARNYFEQDCQMRLSDECAMESVTSEVDECSPVDKSDMEEEDEKVKYECHGNCVPNSDFRKDFRTSNLDEGIVKNINLEDKIMKSECESIAFRGYLDSTQVDFSSGSTKKESVEMTFMRNQLDPYCRSETFSKLTEFEEDVNFPMCIGISVGMNPPVYDKKNYCRELPWWHRANIGSFDFSASKHPGMGIGGTGRGMPPARSDGGVGGCMSSG